MGKLRLEPKQKKPGFIRVVVDEEAQLESSPSKTKGASIESSIAIRTRRGTEIHVSRSMPLKQVARLVKILECRGSNDLG